jgi:non-ribosomal peptide synthetase component E (peptide arylation enzyme)
MVVEKIFEQARRKPAKVAITYGMRNISYGELAFWISDTRQFLSQQGLPPEGAAVLNFSSLIDAWVYGFALRSLGLTTIAVRSIEKLDELGLPDIVCVIITKRDRLPQFAYPARFKLIQVPRHHYVSKHATAVPDLPKTPHTPGGHVLLTSGTTGTSKRVLIDDTRFGLIAARRAEIYGVTERSIVNVFGFGMWSAVGYNWPACAWSMGGAVVIDQTAQPHRSLLVEGITHALFTPGTLWDILQAPPNKMPRSESMRMFVTGGALTRALAAKAKAVLTPHLFTYTGSSEVGTWGVTSIECDEDLDWNRIHSSAELQVVDAMDRPAPFGQMGAVRVRTSDGVVGYFQDEEATREYFRDGFFYSGDLGTLREDGRLALHGRVNNVINILGAKLAAEPIELRIQEGLDADAVCVLQRQNERVREEFHIAIQSMLPIDENKATSVTRPHLPASSFRFHFINPLPRTDTGKIDRTALRKQIFA